MCSAATVSEVLALHDAGLGARRISARLGLPLSTVRDWLAGRLPRHSRPLGSRPAAAPCDRCSAQQHCFDQLPPAYGYLLGLYLGDGSLATHRRGVYRLRITLDLAYPGIIASAADAVGIVRGRTASVQPRRDANCVDVSSYWKSWPCLLPQHGAGPKHARPIVLTDWQLRLVEREPEQLLRGLIHSDGHRFINTGRNGWRAARYGFTQVSDDIRAIFCRACDLVGVRWTEAGGRTIYVSRLTDVAILDRFIGRKM